MSDTTEDWNGSMWTGIVLGTLGALSSESWITIWLIIEINLIRFLPVINKKWSAKKISILYFIVQRVGSLTILTGGIVSDRSRLIRKWLIIGLLLKMGLAPFHYWGGVLIPNLSNLHSYIFLTWQKIAPLILMLSLQPRHWVIVANVIIAAICCTGTKDVKILIFFSSLMHTGWILSSPITVAHYYFILYIVITAPILLLTYNAPLIINLAGLPPMTGFFIKISVIQMIAIGLGVVMLFFSVFLMLLVSV